MTGTTTNGGETLEHYMADLATAVDDAQAARDRHKNEITEPGIYPQITDEEYHADPVAGGSLSSTGARKLLPPSCPALFHHDRINGRPPKQHFDIGHAAHLLVLGAGPELVVVDAPDWRKKAAQEQRDEAHARGAVPLLTDDYAQVTAMADALHQHPIAQMLFDPDRGQPEQTLIWRDEPSGVWCRARLDWLPERNDRGRMILPDYKTARTANPEELRRSIYQFVYHQQAPWYLSGAQALGLAGEDAAFLFVCQEKDPPYLVSVIELDDYALRLGAARNRRARAIYAECTATGRWPGYSDDVIRLQLPMWAEQQDTEEYLS